MRDVEPCDDVVSYEFPNVVLGDMLGGNCFNPFGEISCTHN